jgi:hypothetical protein
MSLAGMQGQKITIFGTVYDANRAAHAPAINYKITIPTILGRTGTNKLWKLASADMLRPMAIGHPIT